MRRASRPPSGPASGPWKNRPHSRRIWRASRRSAAIASAPPASAIAPGGPVGTPPGWRRYCWPAWRSRRRNSGRNGFDGLHQEDHASDAFRAGHRRTLDPAGEPLAATVGGRERDRLVPIAIRQARLDRPGQLSQRQTDIESEYRLTNRLARANAPHIFGTVVPELNAQVPVEHGDPHIEVGHDLLHEAVNPIELDAALLQLGVDRLQFRVG